MTNIYDLVTEENFESTRIKKIILFMTSDNRGLLVQFLCWCWFYLSITFLLPPTLKLSDYGQIPNSNVSKEAYIYILLQTIFLIIFIVS